MQASGIVSAIVIGLIVGALGRLIVPGRQTIGILLTIVLGLVGTFVGGFIAYQFTTSFLIVFIVQVVVAAVLIALFSSVTRSSRARV
jgi:uncharacterized membrane protein YeaQ/YmgE (transglycosylase-associated protein family)